MAQLLSVGTIIDRAWAHYTKHFLELMSISSWLLLLAILNVISIWISPDTLLLSNGTPSTLQIVGLIIYGVTFFLLAPILSIWISNQLTKGIHQQLSGEQVNSKALSRFAWKYFFPRLLVGILTGLLILAPFLALIPGGALSVAAGLSGSSGLSVASTALIFFGVVAATTGCIYMAIRLIFTPYSLLLDDHRGRAAIRASAQLSKNRFWAVFFRVVIPTAIFYIGMMTIQVILIYLMKTIILSIAGLNAELSSQLLNMGRSTLFIIVNMLIAPLVITANCLIYRDLVKNR